MMQNTLIRLSFLSCFFLMTACGGGSNPVNNLTDAAVDTIDIPSDIDGEIDTDALQSEYLLVLETDENEYELKKGMWKVETTHYNSTPIVGQVSSISHIHSGGVPLKQSVFSDMNTIAYGTSLSGPFVAYDATTNRISLDTDPTYKSQCKTPLGNLETNSDSQYTITVYCADTLMTRVKLTHISDTPSYESGSFAFSGVGIGEFTSSTYVQSSVLETLLNGDQARTAMMISIDNDNQAGFLTLRYSNITQPGTYFFGTDYTATNSPTHGIQLRLSKAPVLTLQDITSNTDVNINITDSELVNLFIDYDNEVEVEATNINVINGSMTVNSISDDSIQGHASFTTQEGNNYDVSFDLEL